MRIYVCIYVYLDRYMSVLQLNLKISGYLELSRFLHNPSTEKVLELYSVNLGSWFVASKSIGRVPTAEFHDYKVKLSKCSYLLFLYLSFVSECR